MYMAKYNKKYTKDQVENAVKESKTYSDVFRNLGISLNGGSYSWLKTLISKYEVSTNHFLTTKERMKIMVQTKNHNTAKELYLSNDISNGFRRTAKILRAFLLFNKIEEKCNQCQITHWRDIPLRLDIDHIDNNPLNNSLQNLQFICPNCHRLKTIKKK